LLIAGIPALFAIRRRFWGIVIGAVAIVGVGIIIGLISMYFVNREANQLLQEGLEHLGRARYQAAESAFQEARGKYIRTKNRLGEAKALRGIGDVYYYREEYRRALEDYYEPALTKFNGQDLVDEAETLRKIGNIYYREGEYDTAVSNLLRARTNFRRVGNKEGEAAVLSSIANVCVKRREFNKALFYFGEALNAIFQVESRSGQQIRATIYNNRANLYCKKEDATEEEYRKALEDAQQAITIHKSIVTLHGEMIAHFTCGEVYECMNDFEKAREQFKKALEIAWGIPDKNFEARIERKLQDLPQ